MLLLPCRDSAALGLLPTKEKGAVLLCPLFWCKPELQQSCNSEVLHWPQSQNGTQLNWHITSSLHKHTRTHTRWGSTRWTFLTETSPPVAASQSETPSLHFSLSLRLPTSLPQQDYRRSEPEVRAGAAKTIIVFFFVMTREEKKGGPDETNKDMKVYGREEVLFFSQSAGPSQSHLPAPIWSPTFNYVIKESASSWEKQRVKINWNMTVEIHIFINLWNRLKFHPNNSIFLVAKGNFNQISSKEIYD